MTAVKTRMDKYLWAIRLFKTRSLATAACDSGKVKWKGEAVKPSKAVLLNEEYEVKNEQKKPIIKVIGIIDKRVSYEEAIKNEGEVFLEILPKGKYIVSRQEITLPEFETAWNALFLWMNENGHQFRKECPYEIYHNDYQEHPEKKCLVDFCIPIL